MARSYKTVENDLNKTRAQLNILNNYIETYEMLTDNGQFARQEMANRNAENVLKVIELKEQQIQNLRDELRLAKYGRK